MEQASSPRVLRAAVIGIGRMGKEHARILAALPDVELVAVVDTNAEKRETCAKKHGVSGETDYRNLPDLDAVILATPTRTHAPMACHFLAQGVSTLVEKPIAKNLDEADAMIQAAQAGGAKLQIGHVERFNPAVIALTQQALSPRFIVSERISPFSFRSMDIGVVLDLMIHDIDIILHLNHSEIRDIEAAGFGFMTAAEDVANARITFADGCIANVTASRLSDKSVRHIRVFAHEGYISMDYAKRKAVLYKPTSKLLDANFDPSRIDLSAFKELKDAVFPDLLSVSEMPMNEHEPLAAEVESFLHAVRTDTEPLVSGVHGRRALDTAMRIIECIKPQAVDR